MSWKPRFAITIRRTIDDDWRDYFLQSLTNAEITVDSTAGIYVGGRLIGEGRFVELSDAPDVVRSSSHASPFAGNPVGAFVWNHGLVRVDDELIPPFIQAIAHASLGLAFQLDTHEILDLVVKQSFTVYETLSPDGLEEGRLLLRKDGAYIQHIVDACIAQLNLVKASASIEVDTGESANPLRLRSLTQNQIELDRSDTKRLLQDLDVQIWTLRRDLYADVLESFWWDLESSRASGG